MAPALLALPGGGGGAHPGGQLLSFLTLSPWGGPPSSGVPSGPPATWAAFPESQTRIRSFLFPGGILGAVFNALNYWLTMFRIR